jgi:hypothetical protein
MPHCHGHRAMRAPFVIVTLCLPLWAGEAQTASAPYLLSSSFTTLSNSFNGVPGSRHPLSGWGVNAAFPAWHNLRFVLDYTNFRGTNLGSPQRGHFPTAGGQYSHRMDRETIFGKMLFGEGWLNKNWAASGTAGTLASFAIYAGGGIDTPLSRHLSLRVEGGAEHTNFAFKINATSLFPYYRTPGLPSNFGRFSAGIVWAPRLATLESTLTRTSTRTSTSRLERESEITFEYGSSFGHWDPEAGSWWSYLHIGGLEYDRHSWGEFLGARMDYASEVLPLTLLRQPAAEDEYGDPLSHRYTTLPGLAVTPVGLRMLWRNGKVLKPYFTVKGGVVGYTQKALSPDGAYLNFTLQTGVGTELRLNRAWEIRLGAGDFHFSNARQVPSNPGLDVMMYTVGLSYHLHLGDTAGR